MVKLKRSPKNHELGINVAKTGSSVFFHAKQQIPWQMANSAARRENPYAVEYWWHCSVPTMIRHNLCLQNVGKAKTSSKSKSINQIVKRYS